MITGLSHVAIRTRNILDSVRFYTEVLGFPEAFRMYNEQGELATVYVYIAPGEYLELFSNGTRDAEDRPDQIGMCHICLEVDDCEATCEMVRKNGGVIDSEVKTGHSRCRMFWTHDPDGTKLELMQLTPESLQAQANARLNV